MSPRCLTVTSWGNPTDVEESVVSHGRIPWFVGAVVFARIYPLFYARALTAQIVRGYVCVA